MHLDLLKEAPPSFLLTRSLPAPAQVVVGAMVPEANRAVTVVLLTTTAFRKQLNLHLLKPMLLLRQEMSLLPTTARHRLLVEQA